MSLTLFDTVKQSGTTWGVYACSCGWLGKKRVKDVRNGKIRSCGHLRREVTGAKRRSHGHFSGRQQSPTYSSWNAMVRRCTNPRNKRWLGYGGRGITVCDRWLRFENFFADMGERPIGKTLDRLDVDGNYEPSNCRW